MDDNKQLYDAICTFSVSITELKSDVKHILQEIAAMNASLKEMGPKVQEHSGAISQLQKDNENISKEVEKLKEQINNQENEMIKLKEDYTQTKEKTNTILKVAFSVAGVILLAVLGLVLAKVGITI